VLCLGTAPVREDDRGLEEEPEVMDMWAGRMGRPA